MRLSEDHYSQSDYEKHKRARTIEALTKPFYLRAFEPGCGWGHLSQLLAPRCAQLLSWDSEALAVARARQRVGHLPHVQVDCAVVPERWPQGVFDLIVLAEFLYYLPRATLARVATLAANSLAPGGTLVACHWRHPIPESDLTGDTAHSILDAWIDLEPFGERVEQDFRITTWQRSTETARNQQEFDYGQPIPAVGVG